MNSKTWNIILGIGSVIGFGATIALTIVGTNKAVRRLDLKKKELGVDKLDVKTTLKTALPCYAGAITTGVASIGCVAGAATYALTTQATLAGGIGIVNRAYTSYREKMREIHGEEEDRKIIEEVHKDEIRKVKSKDISISSSDISGEYSVLPKDYDASEGEMLFYIDYYDKNGGVYFTSTVPKVMNAIYHFNRNGSLAISTSCHGDLIEFLGLERTKYADNLVYDYLHNDNIFWIDIGIGEKVTMDDGMLCRPIYISWPPVPTEAIDDDGYLKDDYDKELAGDVIEYEKKLIENYS